MGSSAFTIEDSPEFSVEDAGPNLTTGAGMMEHAQQQATASLPQPKTGMEGTRPSPAIRKGQAEQLEKAYPYVAGAATVAAPVLGEMAGGASLGGALASGGRAVGRGIIGSGLGSYAGERVGNLVGAPEVGKVVGGVAGGALAGSGKMKIPDWTGLDFLNEPEDAAIIKGPSVNIRNSPNFDPEAYKAGQAARVAGPSEAPESSTPGVSVYPEPNEPAPGQKTGSMYSVKRKTVLEPAAQRGQAGATDVLRDLGKPMVLTPREGTGYSGARPQVASPMPEDLQRVLDDPTATSMAKAMAKALLRKSVQ